MNVYPWQTEQWLRAKALYDADRLPHAMLLTGKQGLGIEQFAIQFATAILTDNFTDNGVNESDSKDWHLLQSGNHPDYSLLQPEEEGKQIKVDQVRELIEFLQYTSQYGRKKIAIIEPAEAMNRSSANGLLKTLEEPPADSLLLLVAYKPELLPITIRSRCQEITFSYDNSKDSQEWLQQNISDKSELELAMMITSAPLAAKSLIESEQLEERDTILKELNLLQKQQIEPISIAERWNSIGASEIVNTLQSFFLDMAKLKLLSDKARVSNRDMVKNLLHLVAKLDMFSLLTCCRLLNELKQQLQSTTSFNTQGLLEEFILHWQSLTLSK